MYDDNLNTHLSLQSFLNHFEDTTSHQFCIFYSDTFSEFIFTSL